MIKIWHLIKKELWQVTRDPNMLRVIFIVPMIQLLVLGYAITTDIKNLDILICDFDGSAISRDLIERFSHTDYFRQVSEACKPGDIERYLFSGKAVIALVIPRDFGQDMETRRRPEIQILLDGQNSNTSAVALGYCNRILLQFMQDTLRKAVSRQPLIARSVHMITPVSRAWYNPELKSVYYMIPGIISILLTTITMLLTSMAIVKEKEIGTLEQLMVTPLTSPQIIAGKTIPFAILGFIEMSVAMTFGVLWFKVPIAGSLPVLALLSATYILTTLGLGIFISTIVNTQQQALFLSWFFLVSFILLSGFFYPVENMPVWVQAITYGNPMRYFIEILRELFLKGAGLAVLWPELCCLLGMGTTIFILAALRFHKRTA
ncbi:MAG: ABC transporter permease [Desulfobacteraceae bacterium]|nr:ABC transporter permease [Desulfobacteraceae bacterium]